MSRIPFFDLSRQNAFLSEELAEAYRGVMKKGWFISGEEVRLYESSFAARLGVEYCISCANGTDALELALEAGGVQPGDEVVVPANTWVSVAEAVVRQGAVPVFADTIESAFSLDPASVARCINRKTKAIVVVHQYGLPARMNQLLELAASNELVLIEDCAHAHGAAYNDAKLGSLGDFGCFSFYPTKNLGCFGDGGAVVTNMREKADRLRLTANHGQEKRNVHTMVGRNSRLDELQAAFLNVKLPYLDQWNARRRSIAAYYTAQLGSKFLLPKVQDHSFPVFHQFVIQVENRPKVVAQLQLRGIETAIHYPQLISDMGPYKHFPVDPRGLPVAEKEKSRILSLPVFPELTDGEVETIVAALKD